MPHLSDGAILILLLVVWWRQSRLMDYLKTNEARTDALMKAISGSKFPD